MALDESPGGGTLYRYDARGLTPMLAAGLDLERHRLERSTARRCTTSTAPSQRIDVFDFDAATGRSPAAARCAEIDAGRRERRTGSPSTPKATSGSRCWDGWALRRYRPDGTLERIVDLPGRERPTSCAFGGDDLGDLYVTSARKGSRPPSSRAQPHAGGLFVLRPGVTRTRRRTASAADGSLRA